ncbi:MAG: sigma-70 family RNA polymerase sigma factor [Nitrospirae bacterium]|nr:sigma-70 family RNA polymerase sigma factor [Nitrospirota bacterium]
MGLIRKGDAKAFELLVARHQRAVYNIALRFLRDSDEAEDLTQDVFIRIYKAAATYSPEAKFTTWLYTIVRNLCFNVLRSRKQAVLMSVDDEAMPELSEKGDNPLERITRQEVRERVMHAVGKLPDNMRLAVLLSKYQGLSYDEIAGVMGCSVTAIKLRVHRAKAILAAELSDLRDETGDN